MLRGNPVERRDQLLAARARDGPERVDALARGRQLRDVVLRERARVLALDGAKTLGAKILVAGGGRCNVTHHAVDEKAYAGSSPNAIKNVLRRFGVAETVKFFEAYGVELKREDTGKLFPTTDDAHTILDALLQAARDAGVEIRHPQRVTSIMRDARPRSFVQSLRKRPTPDVLRKAHQQISHINPRPMKEKQAIDDTNRANERQAQ
jgi:hypothetical protein